MKYSKEEAIKIAKDFINEVKKLQEKYNMRFNSNTGDVFFSYKTTEENKVWDTIALGWDGDGTPIKVIEEVKMIEKIKEQALNKLTTEERTVLGL